MTAVEWVSYSVWVNGHLIDKKSRVGRKGTVERLNYLADNLQLIPEVKSFEISVKGFPYGKVIMDRVFSEKLKTEGDAIAVDS